MMIGDTVYPTPALESLIPLIVPAALTMAVPIAVLPERGAENVIVGGLSAEYAAPPLETVMIPTPPVVAIPTVTATPVPPPPWNTTEGGTVYPAPGLVSSILSIEREVPSQTYKL